MLTGWSPADADQQRGKIENGWQGVENNKVLAHTLWHCIRFIGGG